jgi:Rod binding domain-containing protein
MDGVRLNLPGTDVARALPLARTPEEAGPAAVKFQALLGAMLVKEMRSSLSDGFFGTGAGGDVYGGWLDEHVGETLARRDALHLEGVLREGLDRKARQAEEKP